MLFETPRWTLSGFFRNPLHARTLTPPGDGPGNSLPLKRRFSTEPRPILSVFSFARLVRPSSIRSPSSRETDRTNTNKIGSEMERFPERCQKEICKRGRRETRDREGQREKSYPPIPGILIVSPANPCSAEKVSMCLFLFFFSLASHPDFCSPFLFSS